MLILRGVLLAAGLILPGVAGADNITAMDWLEVSEPAFAPGTYGASFVVMGKNEGCAEDEGFVVCTVNGEGLRFQSAYGSVTPEVLLDFLARLPVGAEVLLLGDSLADVGDRVDAVFSHVLPPN